MMPPETAQCVVTVTPFAGVIQNFPDRRNPWWGKSIQRLAKLTAKLIRKGICAFYSQEVLHKPRKNPLRTAQDTSNQSIHTKLKLTNSIQLPMGTILAIVADLGSFISVCQPEKNLFGSANTIIGICGLYWWHVSMSRILGMAHF